MERSQLRTWVRSMGAALVGVLLVGSVVVGQADDAASVGVSTGIFTEEQATAGAEAFALHCAVCHGADLEGGFGPTLAPLSRFQFSDAPLSRLFDLMRTQMPFDDPGSLDIDTYLVILTFILHENGYPTGDEPLSHADDVVAQYLLDPPAAE